MASIWTPPKTDWTPDDGIEDADLNRIECNIEYLYDQGNLTNEGLRDFIAGFTVTANNSGVGVYDITVSGGVWITPDGTFVDWETETMTKVLDSSDWSAGDSQPAKLQGASFSTNGWFWVYALYNPTTNET